MWKISTGADTITAAYDPPTSRERAVFVCAHGAGGNMNDRGIRAVAEAMRAVGLGVVRFNFPYSEKGRGGPDPMPKLTATAAAVVAHVRSELAPDRLIIGGRSMGGRAASMLAADGFRADGLLLLAYPLHPPGQLDKLRDAHLPSITMPVLCFNGTRDTFCDQRLMARALKSVKTTWTMHWLDGADHGFHVLKSSGRTDGHVLGEVATATTAWLDTLSTPTSR
jgi:predicted alpha/beta-hydrolase family hydrolase